MMKRRSPPSAAFLLKGPRHSIVPEPVKKSKRCLARGRVPIPTGDAWANRLRRIERLAAVEPLRSSRPTLPYCFQLQ